MILVLQKTENKILEIYNKSKRAYGYRRIKIALLRELGLVVNHKKIIRLMRKLTSLPKHGIIQSMSRRGNCLDNACIENFFGYLKSELIYQNNYEIFKELSDLIDGYIHWYNYERFQTKLNNNTN